MPNMRRDRGISKYEFLIQVVIAGILAAFLLERFQYYQEYAEKSVMESTVINMRSGMRLRIAALMMDNKPEEIGALLKENPVSWLDRPPANYLGVLERGDQIAKDRYGWYFDAVNNELVYKPHLSRFLQPAPGSSGVIRFRITAKVIAGKNEKGIYTRAEGLEIVSIGQYAWF